jgi:hypothetical protein
VFVVIPTHSKPANEWGTRLSDTESTTVKCVDIQFDVNCRATCPESNYFGTAGRNTVCADCTVCSFWAVVQQPPALLLDGFHHDTHELQRTQTFEHKQCTLY